MLVYIIFCMMIYTAVLLPACAIAIAAGLLEIRSQRIVCLAVVICLTFFSATRGYVGTDTGAYHGLFLDYRSSAVEDVFQAVEPVFAAILVGASMVGDNSFYFLFAISLLQGLLLAVLVLRCKNPALFVALYASTFYINFHFNILRSGVAALFLLLALVGLLEGRRKIFPLFGIISILSHYSSLIFFLPMGLFRQKLNSGVLFWLVSGGFAIFVVLFFLNESRLIQYVKYIALFDSAEGVGFGAGLFLLMGLYISIYCMSLTGDAKWVIACVLGLWCVLRFLSNIFLFVSRVEVVVSLLLLFVLVESPPKARFLYLRLAAIISLVALNLYGVIAGLGPTDQAQRGGFGVSEKRIISPYLPYKFMWEE